MIISFLKLQPILITILSLAVPFHSMAQADDSLLNELARKWNNAKGYALKIAELMPADQYDFKPVPEEMSFGEQLVHIAGNMTWLSTDYLFGRKQNEQVNKAKLEKKQIIDMLRVAYDSALALQGRLTDKQLEETVPFFAGPMSRRQILLIMHDHQSHHLGQLIVYLRLKGIKPPDYVGW